MKKNAMDFHRVMVKNSNYWGEIVKKIIDSSLDQPTDAQWKELKDIFVARYEEVKDWHVTISGNWEKAQASETAEEVIRIAEGLRDCQGIGVDVLGRFIWTKGTQKKYADKLRALGFSFQSDKNKWCKSYSGYVRKQNKPKNYSWKYIRSRYALADDE